MLNSENEYKWLIRKSRPFVDLLVAPKAIWFHVCPIHTQQRLSTRMPLIDLSAAGDCLNENICLVTFEIRISLIGLSNRKTAQTPMIPQPVISHQANTGVVDRQ